MSSNYIYWKELSHTKGIVTHEVRVDPMETSCCYLVLSSVAFSYWLKLTEYEQPMILTVDSPNTSWEIPGAIPSPYTDEAIVQ